MVLVIRFRRIVLAALLLSLAALLIDGGDAVHANGVPIRLPLTYLSGLSNWGPPEARGDAELSFSEATVRIDARGLPVLRDEMYQLWLVKSGTNKAAALATFNAGADGIAAYTGKLTGVEGYDYDLLMLTVEPVNDPDAAPSGKRSLGGFFTPIKKETAAVAISSDVQPAALPSTGEAAPEHRAPSRQLLGYGLIGFGALTLITVLRSRRRA